MRKINKESEPQALLDWKRNHPHGRYKDVANTDISFAIRKACIQEQYGLCAFCCVPIDTISSHNAHLQSQHHFPQKSLLWDNIVASCNNQDSCGKHQKEQDLPLSPLMEECEKELKFYINGKVKGLTQRAQEAIEILNLNNETLRRRRKQCINDFFLSEGYFPPREEPYSWDNEIWQAIMNDCRIPDENGRLLPFAPAIANVGWHLLNKRKNTTTD